MTELNGASPLGELAGALAKAQKSFPAIAKKRTVTVKTKPKDGKPAGTYSYTYADLSDILDAIRGPLADNGLAVVQPIRRCEEGLELVTSLLHASGQYIESTYPLPTAGAAQEMGSAITYARRYTLTSLLGIAAEDDDDGASATDTKAKPAAKKAPANPADAKSDQWAASKAAMGEFDIDVATSARIVAFHFAGKQAKDLEPGEVKLVAGYLKAFGKQKLRVLDALGKLEDPQEVVPSDLNLLAPDALEVLADALQAKVAKADA